MKERKHQSHIKDLAQKYHEDIISLMPGHVYWKDKNGVFLGCNLQQARDAGFNSPGEVVGKTDYDMPWSIQADYLRDIDKKVMNSGRNITLEELFELPDGTKKIYLSNKLPLYNKNNQVSGILGISFDITEKKKLEAEIREMRVREERLKVLSSMGGMIAHELKTPLSGMQLGIDTIKEYLPILLHAYKEWSKDKEEPPISLLRFTPLEKLCDDLSFSLGAMESTVDTILAGFRPLDRSKLECLNLNELIKVFLKKYPLTEEEKKLIKVESMPDTEVFGNSSVICHVLTNLLKNALYAIKEAGKGEITIGCSEDKDHVLLHFKDTAKGIPQENIEKIFEPFFTTKSSATSIGMGLFFCKMALEKMGAKIACESVEGNYTIFTLFVPKDDRQKDKNLSVPNREDDL